MDKELVLYSNNCARCRILKAELEKKCRIFTISHDFAVLTEKNIFTVPCLELPNGTILMFTDAMKYIQEMA